MSARHTKGEKYSKRALAKRRRKSKLVRKSRRKNRGAQ